MEKEQVNNRHCAERLRSGEESVEDARNEQLREIARVRTPESRAESEYGGEEIDGATPINVRKRHPDEWPYAVHGNRYCPGLSMGVERTITNSLEQRRVRTFGKTQ
jgi:hypothetical protein